MHFQLLPTAIDIPLVHDHLLEKKWCGYAYNTNEDSHTHKYMRSSTINFQGKARNEGVSMNTETQRNAETDADESNDKNSQIKTGKDEARHRHA